MSRGLIFHLHTPYEGEGGMVYSDCVPRIGEKIRCSADLAPEHNGIFQVDDVVYGVPFAKVQRIDIYGRKISELPKSLAYYDYMGITR